MEKYKKFRLFTTFEYFFKFESTSGILLILMTVLALIISNSHFSNLYFDFWKINFTIGFENFSLTKPLILWINDGLMSIFFFHVGLEVKREILIGELSDFKKAILPVGAAVGGSLLPALIFLSIHQSEIGRNGWAIPMATDIAFALGIIKFLGSNVPNSLKIFLTAFAIIDDIIAVIVITFFYSSNIQIDLILYSFVLFLFLVLLNFLKIKNITIYIFTGTIIWLLFLKSGIHPTVSAVLLAFFIPAKPRVSINDFTINLQETYKIFEEDQKMEKNILLKEKHYYALENLQYNIDSLQSPIQKLEHNLHGFVSYIIIPVFAFSNAGVVIETNTITKLSFDIATSLILGKGLGIFLFTILTMKIFKTGFIPDSNLLQLLGVSFLGGIGFTMALFISHLSFSDKSLVNEATIGILIGSLISCLIGITLILFSKKIKNN